MQCELHCKGQLALCGFQGLTLCCSLQAHWATTVHLVFLVVSSTMVLSLLPFLYFGLHWYWQWYQTRTTSNAPSAHKADIASAKSTASEAQAGELDQHFLKVMSCLSI